jgi:hypothetical protein
VIARPGRLDDEGWPYVVPVWFQHDGRCPLAIDGAGARRKVWGKGQAEPLAEPNAGGGWVAIANRMATHSLGEHGPDYLAPTLGEPRWLFSIRPVAITTWQGVDRAKTYKHGEWV